MSPIGDPRLAIDPNRNHQRQAGSDRYRQVDICPPCHAKRAAFHHGSHSGVLSLFQFRLNQPEHIFNLRPGKVLGIPEAQIDDDMPMGQDNAHLGRVFHTECSYVTGLRNYPLDNFSAISVIEYMKYVNGVEPI